jgi:single-stranded-DNA-specific exonuclease
MPETLWQLKKHDADAVKILAAELNVRPLTAALLISRGHDNAEKAARFLNPSPEHLHDPMLLKGMSDAVSRIRHAVATKERVMIWGDYDVDGTTGTVLLRRMFRILGIEAEYHIPNRFTEGYGVNTEALKAAKERGVSLVITVDCGSKSFEPLEWAAANGLDVIITDHHLADDEQGNPPAVAVVNPNQAGCPYPEKTLAGVGVAFKLAHAVLRKYGHEDKVPQFLRIAALGTVADMMELTGENRAIVALGLLDLNKTTDRGLRALIDVAGCSDDMTSYHIGFRLAPRINAAGRMDAAKHVVELFDAGDTAEARRLAVLLDDNNILRQRAQQEITELALAQIEEHDNTNFLVVCGDAWHQGVIGLAASRIVEKAFRPAAVISVIDGVGHASARSIPGFHLVDALDAARDLLIQYGGHAMAAGFKIKEENIAEFRDVLNRHTSSLFGSDSPQPVLEIDALVRSESLGLDLVDELSAFEPFGVGNHKPRFLTRGLRLQYEPTIMKDKHLKLKLADDAGRQFEAVWWGGVEKSSGKTLRRGTGIKLVHVLEVNTWQGNRRLQLVVEDLRTDN